MVTVSGGRKAKAEREQTTSIGNYLLSKTIGEGTFGKVKVGVHILTGERVAVKVLEKDRIVDKGDVKRVSREIQILKHIQHPNLIHLLEVIEKPRHLYLVTEHIAGGELFDYIVRNGRLAEDVGCRLFRQIMLAVDACHAMNVIHRDLKPENMMVDDALNLKLIDFGLSNTSEGELLATACGSPCYAAPEMIAGKRYNGPLADIWSLGVCLFAMLCGFLPFEDANTPALYRSILNGEYTLPDFLSDDAKALIRGMLTVDPTQRFTTKAIYSHPWFVKAIREPVPPALTMNVDALRDALTTKIDPRVLQLMEQVGFSREQVEADIRARKRNHCTATFFLLVRRKSDAPLKPMRKPAPPAGPKPAAGGKEEGAAGAKPAAQVKQAKPPAPGSMAAMRAAAAAAAAAAEAVTAAAPGGRAAGGAVPGAPRPGGIPPWQRPGNPPLPPGYGRYGTGSARAHDPFALGVTADGGWPPLPPGVQLAWGAGLPLTKPAVGAPSLGGSAHVEVTRIAPPDAPQRPPVRFAQTARAHNGRTRGRATGGAHAVGGQRANESAVFQFAPPPPLLVTDVRAPCAPSSSRTPNAFCPARTRARRAHAARARSPGFVTQTSARACARAASGRRRAA